MGDERTLKTYLQYLEEGGVILNLFRSGSRFKAMEKPAKVYLNNPNQVYAISRTDRENIGNIRETFFANMLAVGHKISIPKRGDFLVDDRYVFEVGGKNKGFTQIEGIGDAYLAIDDSPHWDWPKDSTVAVWLSLLNFLR